MDIKLLETFCAVIEHGSATRAAAVLNVTQPAVSAQIMRLEKDLGFQLFERENNRLRLTPEARVFYEEVERTLLNVAGLDRFAKRIKDGADGALTIAAHPSGGISLLPPVIARFALARPGVRIQLYTRNSEVVRGAFHSHSYDIGLAEMPIDTSGLDVQVYTMPCVAVLPKNHALAAHDVITPKLLRDERFISVTRERTTQFRLMSVLAEHKVPIRIVAEAEFFASICGMVVNGLGLSIVDPASAAEFAPLGLEVRPFRPAIPYEIGVFRSPDRQPSLVATQFLEHLDAHIGQFGKPLRSKRHE